MAFVIADRVRETTTTTGTGTITLAGAYTGFQAFSAGVGNGNSTYYTISNINSNEWEVGIGTYTSSGNTLSRDTVLSSSNSGSLVNFSAGTKDAFVTQPASRSVLVQSAGSGLFAGNAAFTANGLLYANATTTVATGSTLTFDGTTLSTNGLTATGTTTLSGGTANGVAYLNGSKVVTTGSALTFDGTNLGLGTASPVSYANFSYMTVNGTNGAGFRLQNTAGTTISEIYENSNGLGIFSISNLPIIFGVNNTEQMRLTSTGLGIGTSSPQTKLVVSNGSNENIEFFTGSVALNGGGFEYINRTTATTRPDFNYYLGINGAHKFYISGTEQMRLTSTGLGIGTSSPTQALTIYRGSGVAGGIEVAGNGNTLGSTSFFVGQSSSGDGYVYQRANAPLYFGTNNTTKATLDTAGNLGLGVTPSAWSGLTSFSIASTGSNISSASNDNLFITSGAYYNGTNWIYKATSQAVSQYNQLGGAHKWYYAASGTAGNAITFTQAMTLDASGNLGLGTTSPKANSGYATLTLNNATNGGVVQFTQADTTIGQLFFDGNGGTLRTSGSTSLVFGTANTERARIDSSGNVGIGLTPVANNGILQLSSYASVKAMFETATITAAAPSATTNFDVITQAVQYYTTNASANFTVNIRGNSGTSLNTILQTGQSCTIALLVTNGATPYYPTAHQVDGSSVTPKWQGGTAPTGGNASSVDIYVYTVVKTGSAAFTIFASQTKFA